MMKLGKSAEQARSPPRTLEKRAFELHMAVEGRAPELGQPVAPRTLDVGELRRRAFELHMAVEGRALELGQPVEHIAARPR